MARQHFAIISDEQFQSTRALFRWKGLYLLLGFVAASLVGNVLVTQMFDNIDWGIGWMQVAFLAGGLLVAQFTSLALWCVLGVGPVASRLTITLVLSFLSCFANGGPPSHFVLSMLILQNAVFTMFWLWACVALFTGAKSRAYKLMILLGLCVLVTPVHLCLMQSFIPVQVGWIETLNAYAYAIGFCGYTWLAFSLAWVFGIELQNS